MARYWVGGATGFLGSHLVRCLVDAGHEVVAVSRSGGEVDGTKVRRVDVLDAEAVRESAGGCDGAFLAVGQVSRSAEDAEVLHRVHVVGTRTALGALRDAGVRRAVHVSTSGTIAVGTDEREVHDEASPTPMTIISRMPYYRAKHYGEAEALDANAPPDFEVVIVNPTLLLGPGDVGESSTGDVRRFLERSIPATPAGGLSFVDVRDAADAALAAMERGRAGERYLLCAQNLTIGAFFKRLERLSGVTAPALKLPKSRSLAVGVTKVFARAVEAIGGEPPVEAESVEMGQYFWYCNSSKAEDELGFAPRDPGRTLAETIDDLVARGVVFLPAAETTHGASG